VKINEKKNSMVQTLRFRAFSGQLNARSHRKKVYATSPQIGTGMPMKTE
jgi:hypothetical protein